MISELLKTCYARSLLIKRPETEPSASIDNNSYVDDDQLSIAPSVSSNITCFSQRLASLNRRAQELKMEEKFKLPVGRGRAMDSHISYRDPIGSRENISDDETDGTIANNRAPSPVPSVANTGKFHHFDRKSKIDGIFFCCLVVSSIIGRGRRLAM